MRKVWAGRELESAPSLSIPPWYQVVSVFAFSGLIQFWWTFNVKSEVEFFSLIFRLRFLFLASWNQANYTVYSLQFFCVGAYAKNRKYICAIRSFSRNFAYMRIYAWVVRTFQLFVEKSFYLHFSFIINKLNI